KRSQKIIRDALRKLGDHIGGRWHYNKRVNCLRDCNVLDCGINVRLRAGVRRKHAGDNFFTGEGGKSERANKLLSRGSHYDLNADAPLLKQTDDLGSFVCCNAATDSECNFHESRES